MQSTLEQRAEAETMRLDTKETVSASSDTPSKANATVQPLPTEPPALAHERRILERFRAAIRGCGVVGEDATAATIYLVLISRLLDKSVSAAIKGPSSSGKSFTVEMLGAPGDDLADAERALTLRFGAERVISVRRYRPTLGSTGRQEVC